jgi:hypothetical protein
LPLTHSGLLEPHGNRLAVRHRFHCYAVITACATYPRVCD